MKHTKTSKADGPTQRQLRAAELVRHALVEVLKREDLRDPAVAGRAVTIPEVKMSADLKHALVFVELLGGGSDALDVVAGLNRCAKYLRGRLGKSIELKFTPELKFVHDDRYDKAAHMEAIFQSDVVQRDLQSQFEGEDARSED
jgi:ribosome-binding factor A